MESNTALRPRHGAKAFYVFLCAILGALLFIVIQRALALIYLLLLNQDHGRFSFGLSADSLWLLGAASLVAAVIGGFWYGIWLGLHWYHMVYEEDKGGLFHGFKGHWVHGENKAAPVSRAVVKVAEPVPKTIKPIARLSDEPRGSWEFDDLLKEKPILQKTKPQTISKSVSAPAVVTAKVKAPAVVRTVRRSSAAKNVVPTATAPKAVAKKRAVKKNR